jgi:hypothetical protein
MLTCALRNKDPLPPRVFEPRAGLLDTLPNWPGTVRNGEPIISPSRLPRLGGAQEMANEQFVAMTLALGFQGCLFWVVSGSV